jgi:hypothetical protein
MTKTNITLSGENLTLNFNPDFYTQVLISEVLKNYSPFETNDSFAYCAIKKFLSSINNITELFQAVNTSKIIKISEEKFDYLRYFLVDELCELHNFSPCKFLDFFNVEEFFSNPVAEFSEDFKEKLKLCFYTHDDLDFQVKEVCDFLKYTHDYNKL